MIGVFDSGRGGLNAAEYLSEKTNEDIIFFPDKRNAPYGKKTAEELASLLSAGIDVLTAAGADRILIACCTASTVYGLIPEEKRRISTPIIRPTAKAALRATENGKIALLATERTVKSGAFEKEIRAAEKKVCKVCHAFYSIPAQPLVSIAEAVGCGSAATDGDLRTIKAILSNLADTGADTLILGCTHFPTLVRYVLPEANRLGVKRIISSVKEGADAFLGEQKQKKEKGGRRIFLSLRGNINRN